MKELVLELFEEEKVVFVISSESVFTDDSLHSKGVLADCVEVVQLVGDSGVILTSEFLSVVIDTNCGLHETGQGG